MSAVVAAEIAGTVTDVAGCAGGDGAACAAAVVPGVTTGGVGGSFNFAKDTSSLADKIVDANSATSGGGIVINGSVNSIIESAAYYDSPAQQAASIMRGIVGNHTFVDGNKRTAVQAYRSFAEQVGLKVNKTDDELMDIANQIAKGDLDDVGDIVGAME
jgi:death-on-curing protein